MTELDTTTELPVAPPPLPVVNPAAILAELVELEARLSMLGERKATLRGVLEAEARRQYEQGVVPSWKVRTIGSATLAGAGTYEPVVIDVEAWEEWVVANLPHQAELVLRLPAQRASDDDASAALLTLMAECGATISTEVRTGTLKVLADASPALDAHGPICPVVTAEGEVVAGVEMVRRDGHLMVKLDPAAKARAMAMLVPKTGELDHG